MTEKPDSFLLSTKDAARFLGMAPKTLANKRCSGDGPAFIRIGRTIRYVLSVLEEYAYKNRFASTAEYCRPIEKGKGRRVKVKTFLRSGICLPYEHDDTFYAEMYKIHFSRDVGHTYPIMAIGKPSIQ